GNAHAIRDRALREAQKTSNVKNLIDNLQSVKQIRCNSPMFNPAADHVVPPGTVLIAIRVARGVTTAAGGPGVQAGARNDPSQFKTGSAA
ncbi:MAG: hypothetical protein EBU49_08545, partial [Proteobacteria bacterium]|nr:hypothetical protein [Pseudomonadota bacterium]